MKRDAVQHERAPRSAQSVLPQYPIGIATRLRPFQFSTIGSVSAIGSIPLQLQNPPLLDPAMGQIPGHYFHQGLIYPGMMGGFGKPAGLHTGMNISSIPYNTQKYHENLLNSSISSRHGNKDDEVTSSEEIAHKKPLEEEMHEESNARLELPILNESCRPSTIRQMEVPCLSMFPPENIYESAAKLLFLAIKWARTIPSFLQLSYRDQSILLEESWNELFVLTAAQWAFPVDEAILLGNAVAPTSRHNALEEDARKLKEIITRLNLLRVDHTEHACLKALVLFKAESRGLCEPTHVELLQDQTHVMLHEYCAHRQSHHKGRFGKLLLTLPAVQSISRRGLEELLFKQTVGDVAIDRLLGDLAKAPHP
ncbi:hypothetical protein JTB14_031691 [Gonioctena quinquepunctata]|nr:hypothetical protein JTB14_031691 [Gonioctena quinquepunctata]